MARILTPSDMQYKTVPVYITKVNAQLGQVEAIVSVMGVIDMMDDIIHPGSYTKTIVERAGAIRVLDNHRTDTVLAAIGKPLQMREVSKNELPEEMLKKFPEATGGLWTLTQMLMNTEEGKGAFDRIVAQALNEWSIGFEIIRSDFSEVVLPDGKKKVVRNIREIRLWEYSLVLWGANPATATVDAKNGVATMTNIPTAQPIQTAAAKDAPNYEPAAQNAHDRCSTCLFFQRFTNGGGFCQKYSFEANQDYVCAGYDPDSQKTGENPPERKEFTPGGAQPRLGDHLRSKTFDLYMAIVNGFFKGGHINGTEHRALCTTGMNLLDVMDSGISQDVSLRPYSDSFSMDMLFWAAEGAELVKHLNPAHPLQHKAGRVLSQTNFDRLQRALSEIQAVLNDATYEDSSADGADQAEPPKNEALTLVQKMREELKAISIK